jgi:hypothetical protein
MTLVSPSPENQKLSYRRAYFLASRAPNRTALPAF